MPDDIVERAGTEDHPITVEKIAGRLRLHVGGSLLVDTQDALLLREGNYPPVYYIPKDGVPEGILERTEKVTHCPYKGDAAHWRATLADGRVIDPAAWSYETPIIGMTSIQGHLGFYTRALDGDFDPPAA